MLARTILQTNADPDFVDSLIATASTWRQKELVDLLKQWKENWFDIWLVDWIFSEYESTIKELLQASYHPAMIVALRKYTAQQGITQRNIDKQIFVDPDMFRDFFAIHKNVNLHDTDIESIIQEGFSGNAMVLWSSYVVCDRDGLYMHFSAVTKVKTMESWVTQFHYSNKNFAWGSWEWLDSVTHYLQQRFPEDNLFSILKLNPDDIL